MTQTTSEQIRQWKGPAVFSFSFRPFFLFGALWAALAMLIWILLLSGHVTLATRLDPVSWHSHEFLFGYAFVPLGAVLGACATLLPDLFPAVGAQHIWMAGAFGVMTMAMMTRATLGHTGQSLHAGRGTLAIYVSLIGAVLARTTAAIWTGHAMAFYTLSGIFWIAAFIGFATIYGPCLMAPKPARG